MFRDLAAMPMRALVLLVALATTASAQPVADLADVGSLDGIIRAYYEVVSGPAGQPRDWARDSTLHHPDALVTVVATGPDSETVIRPADLGMYHARSSGLAAAGFFEVEIARRTERYGATAHVWSTYEWRQTEDGPIGGRGVNSIQLVWDGTRWWIVSWMFDGRSDAPPVPEPYLAQ